jgi:hypothetical protein
MRDMNYLVDPQDLVFSAKAHIAGFSEMVKDENIPQWNILELAIDVATEWTQEWDSDQGFGSSDGTYMLKEFIDCVIWNHTKEGKYMTKFTPRLSVVEYSEADHHNEVERMESGI